VRRGPGRPRSAVSSAAGRGVSAPKGPVATHRHGLHRGPAWAAVRPTVGMVRTVVFCHDHPDGPGFDPDPAETGRLDLELAQLRPPGSSLRSAGAGPDWRLRCWQRPRHPESTDWSSAACLRPSTQTPASSRATSQPGSSCSSLSWARKPPPLTLAGGRTTLPAPGSRWCRGREVTSSRDCGSGSCRMRPHTPCVGEAADLRTDRPPRPSGTDPLTDRVAGPIAVSRTARRSAPIGGLTPPSVARPHRATEHRGRD